MQQPMNEALRTIRAEHRSLSAVLLGLKSIVGDAAAGRARPDFPLLWRMLYYIEAYPDRLHHPKEDRELFPRLRARSTEGAGVVDELERQHGECAGRLDQVRIALGHLEAGVGGALSRLEQRVDEYAEFYWRHMLMEEQELLPLAEKHLSQEDWQAVADSFAANRDPLEDEPETEFWRLLREIVKRAPAPLGLG